jgi:hypothetical protein
MRENEKQRQQDGIPSWPEDHPTLISQLLFVHESDCLGTIKKYQV